MESAEEAACEETDEVYLDYIHEHSEAAIEAALRFSGHLCYMAAMAKMVTLHRCGKEIAINADQIKWIEPHPSTKGTLIHFMSGHPLDVDEAPDAVCSTVNGPSQLPAGSRAPLSR